MAHLQLTAQKRTHLGHKAKQIQRVGQLPAVIYSKTVDSTPIQIDYKEFYHLYKESGKTTVIDIKVDGDKSIPCIVHDIDLHPVKDTPRHVDFLAVNLKEKITTAIPVEIIGEAPAIKEFGAVVNVIRDELEVTALPDKLPESIIVDISSLAEMSDTITIEDLAGQEVDFVFDTDDRTTTIVALSMPTEDVVDEEPVDISTIEGAAPAAEPEEAK